MGFGCVFERSEFLFPGVRFAPPFSCPRSVWRLECVCEMETAFCDTRPCWLFSLAPRLDGGEFLGGLLDV